MSIETLFDQIEDTVDLEATENAPYMTLMVVNIVYQTVFTTGLFYNACRGWRRRPAIQKTWANLKTYFAISHQELMDSQPTIHIGGFHAENIVEIHQETLEALANLDEAKILDRKSVEKLNKTKK